jgi:hypothetical protein
MVELEGDAARTRQQARQAPSHRIRERNPRTCAPHRGGDAGGLLPDCRSDYLAAGERLGWSHSGSLWTMRSGR